MGKFVTSTLQHPEESSGKALKVQSFVVTPNEVLAEYEKQAGLKFNVIYTPLDEIREFETQVWNEGHPVAVSVTLRRIWAEGGTLYEKNDNERLGLKSDDLESLADGVKKALAGGYKSDTF